MARKKHDKDFKLEAVNMVTNQQRPVAVAARKLGIHKNTLSTKRKQIWPQPDIDIALR